MNWWAACRVLQYASIVEMAYTAIEQLKDICTCDGSANMSVQLTLLTTVVVNKARGWWGIWGCRIDRVIGVVKALQASSSLWLWGRSVSSRDNRRLCEGRRRGERENTGCGGPVVHLRASHARAKRYRKRRMIGWRPGVSHLHRGAIGLLGAHPDSLGVGVKSGGKLEPEA